MGGHIRIGELLVRWGFVTEDQLAEALRAQVVRGGRIGTNLVELSSLDLDRLADALARQHNMPSAHQVHFECADPELIERLPSELAHQWKAIPLGHVEGLPPDHLAVAVMDPLGGFAEDELFTALGGPIVAAIAPELRVLYYLERLYGKPRANRFKRVPTAIVKGVTLTESLAEPSESTGVERRRFVETIDGREALEEQAVVARIEVRKTEPGDRAFAGERSPAVDLASLEDTLRAIRRATGRDAIGDIVVNAMRDGFDRCLDAGVIMIVREDVAVGWKGFVRDGLDEAAEELAVPLSLPSRLRDACEHGEAFFGPVADEARIEPRMWQLLGTPAASAVVVVPVVLLGEIVALLYAQLSQSGALEGRCSEGLAALAVAMSTGFERLARAAQR